MLVWVENSSLLPHWLRVGDGGGEEAVPLHSAVETSPLVVPGAGVRETPWYQGPVLLVAGVALALPVSTHTHPSLGPGAAPALLDVVVLVDQPRPRPGLICEICPSRWSS